MHDSQPTVSLTPHPHPHPRLHGCFYSPPCYPRHHRDQGEVGLPGDPGQTMVNGAVEFLGFPKGHRGIQVCCQRHVKRDTSAAGFVHVKNLLRLTEIVPPIAASLASSATCEGAILLLSGTFSPITLFLGNAYYLHHHESPKQQLAVVFIFVRFVL